LVKAVGDIDYIEYRVYTDWTGAMLERERPVRVSATLYGCAPGGVFPF